MGLSLDDSMWLTRALAAALVGLGPRQFDEAVRPRLPDEALRGEGRKLRYHAPDVVSTFVAYKLEQHRPRPELLPPDAGDDGPDSPALERQRLANARLLELELERELDRLIPRDELEPAVAQFAATIRKAGEDLTRKFGNDAGGILRDAVDEAEASWRRAFAAKPPPDATDAPTADLDGRAGAAAADAADGPVR